MAPAADVMADALAGVSMTNPVVPIIANVTAAPVTEPAEARQLLVEQVTGRVRWRECVLAMKAAGVTKLIEVGHGKVLSGMTRRIDRELESVTVGTPDEIAAVLSA